MDCPIKSQEDRQCLLDYVAGRLDTGRAAKIERHMEGCPDCARFVAAQQFVWNALSQWQPQPVSAEFDRRLHGAIGQTEPVSWIARIFGPFRSPRQSWLRPMAPFAAACIVIVAVVLLHSPDAALTPPDATARIEKIEPEQVERTLDDIEMLRELEETPPSPKKTPQSI